MEGDAERFLVPAFAKMMGHPLDEKGITVCSVAGTNFTPYVKLLTGLNIPYAVITDWDFRGDEEVALGWNRTRSLVEAREIIRTGSPPVELLAQLDAIGDPNEFCTACEGHGIFSNIDTLEIDLFNSPNFRTTVLDTLREGDFGAKRKALIEEWAANPDAIDKKQFLALVDDIGKGRFAQRLVTRLGETTPLQYIASAIDFVVSRV